MVNAPLAYAGFLGCTAVIAGAVGSHGLKSCTEEQRHAFVTGANYQLMHSMAALGALAFSAAVKGTSSAASQRLTMAAWMFLSGTTLFSGSIYARTFGAPAAIGPIAPMGGYVMMGGWAALIAAAVAL